LEDKSQESIEKKGECLPRHYPSIMRFGDDDSERRICSSSHSVNLNVICAVSDICWIPSLTANSPKNYAPCGLGISGLRVVWGVFI